ncbi:hypothetical protein BDZ89DRAFT_1058983 [Hymenopellis radicata]|nr:hypothetical protein BDZ89DRAFT_1058983 [Hymenopellis radicata]
MARLFLLCLLGLASLISAVDIRGRIQWNEICPGPRQLGPARVILDNGKMGGGVVVNGSFTIYDVPEGVYILSISAHDHAFDLLRIDVLQDTVEARPYMPATPLNPAYPNLLAYPFPMVLMMIFTGGMVLAMPYLMKNMDPESLEEFKGQQAKMAKMQNAITSGDFKSGFSAMMAGDEPKDKEPSTSKSSPAASGKSKGKKRK